VAVSVPVPVPATSTGSPVCTSAMAAPRFLARVCTFVVLVTVYVWLTLSAALTVIEVADTALTCPRMAWWVTKVPFLPLVTHSACSARRSAPSPIRLPL
jgi:hypothetical protein